MSIIKFLLSFNAFTNVISIQLVLGPSGVLQGIRPGKCYVEMSTVDPETIIELAQVTCPFLLEILAQSDLQRDRGSL